MHKFSEKSTHRLQTHLSYMSAKFKLACEWLDEYYSALLTSVPKQGNWCFLYS